ncbi:hypothetical protein ACS0TY_028835 [Phlomoides rotata]
MDVDQNPSPTSPTSLSPVAGRRFQRNTAEDVDGGDPVACTGKSCQSCTAAAIADCVAVCCCPCAVVNIFVLAFLKLPYAVARKCLRERRNRSRRRRMLLEERRDKDGISEKEEGKWEICAEEVIGVSFRAEEVWLEPLGFGRVSFTGINFHTKGS